MASNGTGHTIYILKIMKFRKFSCRTWYTGKFRNMCIPMSNTFDLDIDVLTFDLSKRGQNDFPSKISTRIRIQHTRKPPYTNFLKMYPKTRTQLKYEFYALTIVTMLSTILCKTVQLATQCHVGILYINNYACLDH